MAERELQGRTLDQLLERFAELVSLADGAPEGEAIVFRNEMGQIENELKARGPDHTNGLMSLAMHPDETVRMEAMAALFRIMTGNPDVDARLVHQVAVATNAPFLKNTASTRRTKRMPVSDMTDEQLVERFVVIAESQDEANLYGDTTEYNRLYDLMEEVEQELRSRPGDGRHALTEFLDHENAQVRYKAAVATLALAPEAARAVLQKLSDRNRYPEAADARSMLDALDDGSYVPT